MTTQPRARANGVAAPEVPRRAGPAASGGTARAADHRSLGPRPAGRWFTWLAALVSIAVTAIVVEQFDSRRELLVVLVIGVLVLTINRLLGRGYDWLSARNARNQHEARPPKPAALPPTASPTVSRTREEPAGPRPEHLAGARPEYPVSARPQHPAPIPIRRTPQYPLPAQPPRWPPNTGLQPLAFVSATELGTADWRLPPEPTRAGVQADQATVGDLVVRAAAVVGPSHRHDQARALPCQDSYQLGTTRDGGYLLVAVADGVGNSPHSDHGSALAAKHAVRTLRQLVDDEPDLSVNLFAKTFHEAAVAINQEARQMRRQPADYCTTLITALVPSVVDPNGVRRVRLAWVGDSSAWVLGSHGWNHEAGTEKGGFDRNAIDSTLPGRPDQLRQTVVDLQPGQALALMSDGLGDALTDVTSTQEELARRWARPPSLPRFLRDLLFDAPGQTDDRTAVLVWTPPDDQERR